MGNKIDVTQKLVELVKQRKTPVIITKQNSDYKSSRRSRGSFASAGYFEDSDE